MLSILGVHEMRDVSDANLRALNPQVHVVSRTSEHPDAFAKMLARTQHVQRLLPHTKVIVRHQTSRDRQPDDQRTTRYNAQQIADLLFSQHIPNTLLMPDNEASTDKNDMQVFSRTCLGWERLVRLANDARIPLAIGCTPTGTPEYGHHDLMLPVLVAMRDGAAQREPVVHWLYHNAYADPNDPNYKQHHLRRNVVAYRGLCQRARLPQPPAMYGEIGIAWRYDPHAGYMLEWDAGRYAAWLAGESQTLEQPGAIFGAGVGIYDELWKWFNVDVTPFWDPLITRVRRVPLNTNEVLEQTFMDQAKATLAPPPPRKATKPAVLGAPQVGVLIFAAINVRSDEPDPTDVTTQLGRFTRGERISYYPQTKFARGTHQWMWASNGTLEGWIAELDRMWEVAVSPPPVVPPPPITPPPPPVPPPAIRDRELLLNVQMANVTDVEFDLITQAIIADLRSSFALAAAISGHEATVEVRSPLSHS